MGVHHNGINIGLKNGENPCLKGPLKPRVVQSIPLSARTTEHMWALFVRNRTAVFRHARGSPIMGWCMCAPCFSFSFENSELNRSTALRI